MLNNITVMGRLVKEPELRYTNSQKPVIGNTIAVDRDFKDASGNKITDFIDIVAWNSTAEFISKYAQKGSMVVAQGNLQIRVWEDKDGTKRRSPEILVSNFYFAESKKSTSDSNVNESDLPEATAPELVETDEGDLPF